MLRRAYRLQSLAICECSGQNASVKVPILVTCDCGTTTSGLAGEEVACEGCGRRYATSLSAQQAAAVHSIQGRMKAFARLGTGIVGLIGLLSIVEFGPRVGFAVLLLAVVAWWIVLLPLWRNRAVAQLRALPPGRVQPL
jgi:hypothetical protein